MKKKKLGAMLLSVVMVLGAFPAIVFAEPGEKEDPGTFADLQAEIESSQGMVSLSRNYVAGPDDTCIVIDGKSVTLFLNGKTIDRNLGSATAPQKDGHVFELINGGSLTIDQGGSATGKITGGYAYNGGGIYVSNGSTLYAHGSTITGNRAGTDPDDPDHSGCGGCIFYEGGILSTTNMIFATKIQNNSATRYGGGIYNAATISMQRQYQYYTEITGNGASISGGGIYNAGTCTIGYGTIERNWAGSYGGGVYQEASATLTMMNDHDIQSNTSGESGQGIASNLYLSSGSVISVGSFSDFPTKIGITSEGNSEMVITSGYANANSSTNPTDVFSSDSDEMSIALEEGEVVLKAPEAEEKIEYAFCSVTLDGKIGLNAYMDLSGLDPSLYDTANMRFVVSGRGGGTYDVGLDTTKYTVRNGIKYYRFTCYLSSVQMAADIDVTFTYEGGEPVKPKDKTTQEEKTISVMKYLQALSYDQMSDFEKAFIDYGYYVQKYLDEIHNDWTVGSGEDNYAEMILCWTGSYGPAQISEIQTSCGGEAFQPRIEKEDGSLLDSVSYKLELDYENALIVTFTVADGATLTASCEYNGETFKAYKIGENTYRLRIKGIYLQQLNAKFVITGTCGSDFTVYVSPYGYINSAVTNGSYKKKNAMAALYFLHRAAITYCNQ